MVASFLLSCTSSNYKALHAGHFLVYVILFTEIMSLAVNVGWAKNITCYKRKACSRFGQTAVGPNPFGPTASGAMPRAWKLRLGTAVVSTSAPLSFIVYSFNDKLKICFFNFCRSVVFNYFILSLVVFPTLLNCH